MIAKVILWQNGMVMVFNENGQQMPEFQGPSEDVRERLEERGWPKARWERMDWS